MLEALLNSSPAEDVVAYNQFITILNNSAVPELKYDVAVGNRNRYIKVKVTSSRGSMWGTPFKDYVTYDSSVGSIVCHAFPTIELLQQVTDKSIYCAFKTEYVGTRQTYNSVTRNGFTSTAYRSFSGCRITDFIYYDQANGKMMRWDPFSDSEIVPFNGVLY